MTTFFNSLKVKMEVENLYHNKLDELGIPYEFIHIETSFGNTNIIHTGTTGKPPLVLLHGANGCAPVAMEALSGLEKDFNIYAIDVIGQPNLSAAVRPNLRDEAYGQWMFELLTRLNIWEVTLVGISFGGFISWKTLAFDEKRIAHAFLIVPAGIVNGNPLKTFWKMLLPMKQYKWHKKSKYLKRLLKALFTEPDTFAFAFLSKVCLHFNMDFSPIPLIQEETAQRIKTSISIIAADNDLLFPGEKLLKRANTIFPSLKYTLLLHNSKHVPSKKDNEQIIELIKKSNYDK